VYENVSIDTLKAGLRSSGKTPYDCPYCGKYLASSTSRCNHKKICKHRDAPIVPQTDSAARDTESELREEVNMLRERLLNLEMKDASNNININNSTVNSIVNNTFNFDPTALRRFGNENLSYITEEVFKRIIKTPPIILSLAKEVHCNSDHPENMNLLVRNKNGKDAMVYDSDRYHTRDKKQVMLQTMVLYRRLIEDMIGRFDLNRRESRRCESIIENFDYIIDEELELVVDQEGEDAARYVKVVINQVESLLYDYRDEVERMKTKIDHRRSSQMFGNEDGNALPQM
jgi:ElaB/YqjD/DUF883 family membrane-anchored ribosome-binding protein